MRVYPAALKIYKRYFYFIYDIFYEEVKSLIFNDLITFIEFKAYDDFLMIILKYFGTRFYELRKVVDLIYLV